jgi:uncharacterized membrane protein YfhO
MRKKRDWRYAAAFFLPFLVSVIICASNGVFPFGDRCILHVDMYHQYCPFFTEFLNKLQSGESLLYTWNVGLGSDFTALYAYYLASPLNWLLFFWPKSYVIEFMTLAILLKIGLAGLCMFLYLDGHFRRGKALGSVALVFSSAYALSGFVAAYSWDIMWMDGVALAPLVILGLERLVREKKTTMYYISLAVAIWSNYYIGMILCLFLVFYFVLLFAEQKEGRGSAFCRFAGYSLLAGGSAAVLLIPEAVVLGYSGSAGISVPKSLTWYFGLLPELSRSCTMASVYTGAEHWPNLYAGSFSLLLVVLYVLNRRIRWQQKVPRLLMLAFFLVSFSNNYLDFFWHGLHFPDSLPGRQSFLYIFLVLVLGYETLMEWEGVGIARIGLAAAVVGVLLVLSAFVTEETVTDSFAFMITGLFCGCYLILMLLSKLAPSAQRRYVCQLACLLALGELTVNMESTGFYTTSRTSYLEKMEDYSSLLADAQELAAENADTEAFFRVEDPQRTTKNDSALYGYASATEFSSLMNINVSHFYQSLFMEGGKNFYCYNGSTPLTSAMFSVKYVLLDTDKEDGQVRRLVAQCGDQYLYENTYCLPLGYLVPQSVIDRWDDSNSSHISNLNRLAELLGAEADMLSGAECGQEVTDGSTTITISGDGIYYAAYEKCNADTLKAVSSSGWERKYGKTTHRYLLELGSCEAGDTITITNTKEEAVYFEVYRLNLDAVDAAYRTLAEDTLEVTAFSDTCVEGTIEVTRAGNLVLSIPSQTGWNVYVDGILTETESFQDALIGVPLTEGEHSIKLTYCTPGLLPGAAISAGCVLLFLALQVISYRKAKKRRDATDAKNTNECLI